MSNPSFAVGDRVFKYRGDYGFDGIVRAVVTKASGAIRYVVEDDRGLLFIFNATQLMKLDEDQA